MRLLHLLTIFSFLQLAFSLNIVFYISLIGKSHVSFINSLMKLLTEEGHNVDLLVGRLNSLVKLNKNNTASRKLFQFGFPNDDSPWGQLNHLTNPFMENRLFDFHKMPAITTELCSIGLRSGEPLEFLKKGNYDLMLSSDYDYCGHILGHRAGIKSILSYTATNFLFNQLVHLGLPNPVSTVLDSFDDQASFSLMSKMTAFFKRGVFYFYYEPKKVETANKIVRSLYGEDFPSVHELVKNTDLVFLNSNEFIELPRTISHKVVYIGGIALNAPKAINQDFEKLLSLRPKGSVIFSFGTQVESEKYPMYLKLAFVRAAASFPEYTFIWKYNKQPEDEHLFQNATNLHIVNWLPQNELLNDSRVVGFITHMGLNSLLEAAFAGVPLVGIPLFADQPSNARTASQRGIAVALDKIDINEEKLTHALQEILENPTYLQASKRLANLLKGNTQKMKRRFLESVELAGNNPNLHEILNLQEASMGVLYYYCFDVIAAFAAIGLITVLFLRKILLITKNVLLASVEVKKTKKA